jgi:hypothetical protein
MLLSHLEADVIARPQSRERASFNPLLAAKIELVNLPRVTPMPLARLDRPFDHPDWIFEPKLFGFRAVAYIDDGVCRLV